MDTGSSPKDTPAPGPSASNETIDLFAKYPAADPVTELDGQDLRALFWSAYQWLSRHREQVNRLNVFPVPDGDTGTNMTLTMQAAWKEIQARGGQSVGSIMSAAAGGAHQGSRGNSGVILGLILQGMHHQLENLSTLSTGDLARALATATRNAYDGVRTSGQSPVEGTILTVCREVSEVAQSLTGRTPDLREMLGRLTEAARLSVQRTPELLPVLKQAGVVDSGGTGLAYVIEGMYRAFVNEPPAEAPDPGAAQEPSAAGEVASLPKGQRPIPQARWGFDVQLLIEKPTRSLGEIQAAISAMGDYPLVEGDERLVKVHVHVFDPGQPLSYAVQVGFVTDVVVENMDDMALGAQIGVDQEPEADGPAGRAPLTLSTQDLEEGHIGVVVVSPGPGLDAVFRSLGAHAIVSGGQTMNPSTQELVAAVEALAARRVLILPNNKNILLAANQAAEELRGAPEERRREVMVVPSRTVPQGIAALTEFSSHAEALETLSRAMTDAAAVIHTGEITTSVRETTLNGIQVGVGDIIGLQDGRLVVAGDEVVATALALLAQMEAAACEFITIYYGAEVSRNQAEHLAQLVTEGYNHQDVELIYGGQPYYHYILSTE